MLRRAQFYWLLIVVLWVAALGLTVLALSAVFPLGVSALSAILIFGLAGTRLPLLKRDPPRPRWVVTVIDIPAFVVLLGGVLALPVFVLASGVALLAWLFGVAIVNDAGGLALPALAIGFLLALWGVCAEPRRLRLRRHELQIADLPAPLDGYRVVHLSDLHLGSFSSEARAERWIDAVNALGADAVAVTGDLVSEGALHYPLAARVLSRLRGRDGVFVCLGNHDTSDPGALTALLTAEGLVVLRDGSHTVYPKVALQTPLVFAGLDIHRRRASAAKLAGLLSSLPRGLPTVLLAHYPEHAGLLRPKQVALMLAGHTHGGQLGVPGVGTHWNLAALTGQASARLFGHAACWLHVSAGLGTSGPPIRLGVPPEIALLVLRTTTLTARFET